MEVWFYNPFLGLVFLIIAGSILFHVATGLAEWQHNNQSPREEKWVTLVSKRQEVTRGGYYNGRFYQSTSSTTYYVTVEYEDGERQEFRVKGRVYGLLAEGDKGLLTYQGTRFLEFVRQG